MYVLLFFKLKSTFVLKQWFLCFLISTLLYSLRTKSSPCVDYNILYLYIESGTEKNFLSLNFKIANISASHDSRNNILILV